ncbi:MAG: right-handed parallel beta-helix repeat-containing protein [Patescibacteria group bacterium]|nr:right-handed parallel beta-helix repeat-containing protein [Patescibacteria group bacterium]
MTALLSPTPVQKFFDNNGNPLFNGQLFTYAAGTTTPQATYTDYTMGTQNTNPVILNSRGEANVWLNPALAYKLVLEDSSGNQIWSVDNINNLSNIILTLSNIAALRLYSGVVTGQQVSITGYTTAGDGGGGPFYWGAYATDNGGTTITPTGQTVGSWYRLFQDYLNVAWFGAKGDGVTDDSAAINACIAAAAVSNVTVSNADVGSVVKFLPKTYLCHGIVQPNSNVTLDMTGAILKCNSVGTTLLSIGPGNLSVNARSRLCNVIGGVLDGNDNATIGLATNGIKESTFQKMHIKNCAPGAGGYGVYLAESDYMLSFKDCQIYYNGYAVYGYGDNNAVTFDNCDIENNENGMYVAQTLACLDFNVTHCTIQNNGNYNIQIVSSDGLYNIRDNYFEVANPATSTYGNPTPPTASNLCLWGSTIAGPYTLTINFIGNYIISNNGGVTITDAIKLNIKNGTITNNYVGGLIANFLNFNTVSERVEVNGNFIGSSTTEISGNFANVIRTSAFSTSVTGTSAGSFEWIQEKSGYSKRVIVVFNGYENTTTTAQTITMPTPFAFTKSFIYQDTGMGLAATLTTITLPISMASPVTGISILEGI